MLCDPSAHTKAIKRYLILYREHVSAELRRAPRITPPPISITSTGLGIGIGIQMRMGMTADGRTSRPRTLRQTRETLGLTH